MAPLETRPRPDRILRFRISERWMHWAIAIPFMVCYATALILVVFYNPHPLRPFRAVFSWTHRLSGVCLIVFPLIALLRNRAEFRMHLENIREGWIWHIADFKWLMLSGLAAISSKVKLPDQGKFNAAEKLNFMTVMSTYPLFIVTGVLIWLPGIAFSSWLVHFALAVLVTPLLAGHIFMATVNPSTRVGLSGMVSGFVDRTWASHHYARWYREKFGKPAPAPVETPIEPAKPQPAIPVFQCCPGCREEHPVAFAATGDLRELLEAAPPICPDCGADLDVVTVLAELDHLGSILRELEPNGARELPPRPLSPAPQPPERVSSIDNAAF
jgi:formate dehydrogenase subunit gamma